MCKMCERLFTGRKQAIMKKPLVSRAVLLPGFSTVNSNWKLLCLPLFTYVTVYILNISIFDFILIHPITS